MKKQCFLLLLLVISGIKAQDQKPECGSARHCYNLLKQVQQCTPERREQLSEEFKDAMASYAQYLIKQVVASMDKSTDNPADAKGNSLIDEVSELRDRARDSIEKTLNCQEALEWLGLFKDSFKMEYDVDEFDCNEVFKKAVESETAQFTADVETWLDGFDTHLPENNYKKLPALAEEVLKLQTKLENLTKSLNEYTENQNEKHGAFARLTDFLLYNITTLPVVKTQVSPISEISRSLVSLHKLGKTTTLPEEVRTQFSQLTEMSESLMSLYEELSKTTSELRDRLMSQRHGLALLVFIKTVVEFEMAFVAVKLLGAERMQKEQEAKMVSLLATVVNHEKSRQREEL